MRIVIKNLYLPIVQIKKCKEHLKTMYSSSNVVISVQFLIHKSTPMVANILIYNNDPGSITAAPDTKMLKAARKSVTVVFD